MLVVLRILAVFAVLAIGGSLAAWLYTSDRRYLTLAWRVTKGALALALGLMALLAAERLIVL